MSTFASYLDCQFFFPIKVVSTITLYTKKICNFEFFFFTAEPTSLNPTNTKAHEENFVVASGTKNWNDVINDWKALINGLNEPHAYVCEKRMYLKQLAIVFVQNFSIN